MALEPGPFDPVGVPLAVAAPLVGAEMGSEGRCGPEFPRTVPIKRCGFSMVCDGRDDRDGNFRVYVMRARAPSSKGMPS